MTKGVLWVSSRVTQPDKLSGEKFCDWYENIHIQQVLALSGVPSAIRYEAIAPQPTADTWSSEAPWLTIYEMPSIAYRTHPDFLALDGQSPPSPSLLAEIFKNARFDTRFYAEVQEYLPPTPSPSPSPPSPSSKRFLISAAFQPPPTPEATADFDNWYRQEHLADLARAPGYVRTCRYELVNGTTLNEFERLHPEPPRYLALHEFEGEGLPYEELGESARTEWAGRVVGGLEKSEVGWYVKKRDYPESEWASVGK